MSTATSTRLQAEQLIQELDRMTASGEFQQVALATPYGLIYSFQKHKVWNMEGVIARGYEPLGFIGVMNAGDRLIQKAVVTFWTLVPDDESFLNMLGSGYARSVVMVGNPDSENLNEMFDFSQPDEERDDEEAPLFD
jgi:hypothetical protein